MPTFRLTILTPEGPVFQEDVKHVSAPGWDGGFGVLASHAPMVAVLRPGRVAVRRGDTIRDFYVEDGIVEIRDNRMTLLASRATAAPVPPPHDTRPQ